MRRKIVAGDERHVRGMCSVIGALPPKVRTIFCNEVTRKTGELADQAGRAYMRGDIDEGWRVGNEARGLFETQNCCHRSRR